MLHTNWRDVVANISRLTRPVTAAQLELGASRGVDLPPDLPAIVAGSRLQTVFAEELGLSSEGPCTASKLERLAEVAGEGMPSPRDSREADAWIEYFRLKARASALERMELEAGDVVEVGEDCEVRTVSSIDESGRVFFRGGRGDRAWPDMLVLRHQRSDESANARIARRQADNQIAARTTAKRWSMKAQRDLRQFLVAEPLTPNDIDTLRATLATAQDERALQQLFEARPALLCALLGGHERYCLPHPRLGSQRVPDFAIAEVNSLGVRWILVELETPRSEVTLADGSTLEAHARKGVSQVREWREWLQNNLAYARQTRRNDGLGLVDIRPKSEGLVLVGRRHLLSADADRERQAFAEESNILVHTYDWLLERLAGTLAHVGPWASNPYRLAETEDF
jgi:hypothetical protein